MTSNPQRLAIVVPYFKKKYFAELMEALAAQTDMRFAVYIGNDNSSEDPVDVIDSFRGTFPIKYHCFVSRLGDKELASQWNRCLQLTAGEEWVWVLPDDDLPSTNCVTEFYRALDVFNDDSINVLHISLDIRDAGGLVRKARCSSIQRESSYEFYRKHLSGEGIGSTLGNVIYRRSELMKEGGFVSFPKGWGSDHATMLRVASDGDIVHLRNACLTFRMSDLNVSADRGDGSDKLRARVEFVKWIMERENVFDNKPDSSFYQNFFFKGEHYFLYKWDFSISAFFHLWRLRWICFHRPEVLRMTKILLTRARIRFSAEQRNTRSKSPLRPS